MSSMSCGVRCVTDRLLFVLAMAGAAVYVCVLFTVIKFKKLHFKGAFHEFIINLGFADLSYLLVYYLLYMFPTWGWFQPFYQWGQRPLANITMMSYWWLKYCQFFGCALVTGDRFLAFFKPQTHHTFWSPKKRALALSSQWLLALVSIGWVKISLCDFKYIKLGNSSMKVTASSLACRKTIFVQSVMFCVPLAVVLGCLYIYMFNRAWSRIKAAQGDSTALKRQQRALKLAVNGFMIFLAFCLLAGYNFFVYLNPKFVNENVSVHKLMNTICQLVMALTSPFALLLLSAKLRTQIKGMMPGKKNVVQASSTQAKAKK